MRRPCRCGIRHPAREAVKWGTGQPSAGERDRFLRFRCIGCGQMHFQRLGRRGVRQNPLFMISVYDGHSRAGPNRIERRNVNRHLMDEHRERPASAQR